MASGISFSRLASPALTTAALAVDALKTYDRDYAAGASSISPGQSFSNIVLGEYYRLCCDDGLVPTSGPQATDPQWAEHYFHEFPAHRCAAVANVVDRIAKAISHPPVSCDLAALTTKIDQLENALRVATEKSAREIGYWKLQFNQERSRSSDLSNQIQALRAQQTTLTHTPLSAREGMPGASAHVAVGSGAAGTRPPHGPSVIGRSSTP